MIARLTRHTPLAAGLAAMVIAASALGAPPWVEGADDRANPMDRTIVDVADLPPVSGPAGIPRERLLALERGEDGQTGSARLAIIEHGDGRWTEVASLVADTTGQPWLIDAGGGIFAIVSGSTDPDDGGATTVTTVTVGEDTIQPRDSVTLDFRVISGAAADADGDGSLEVVLAGRSDRRRLGVCVGTRIVRLDPIALRISGSLELRELEFDGAVLGEYDGRAGAELAGLTRCAVPGTSPTDRRPSPPRIVGVRLSDGGVSLERTVEEGTADVIRALDLDFDGSDELVVSSARGPLIVRPGRFDAQGTSRMTTLANADSMLPLFASSATATGPSIVVMPGSDRVGIRAGTVDVVDIDRPGTTVFSRSDLDGSRWAMAVAGFAGSVARREPAVGLWVDLGEDGCPDLLMPLFIIACADPLPNATPLPVIDPTADHAYSIRQGPAWVASRPVGTVGRGTATRLLVAQSVGPAELAALRAPTPLVAWQGSGHGGWRAGPSGPFVLSELSLPDLLYFPVYPVPEPTMEGRAVGRPSVVKASGWSGTNYLVRTVALEESDSDTGDAPTLAAFLEGFPSGAARVDPGETRRVVRIDVTPGHPAGADTAAATIPLDDPAAAGDGQPRRWVVTFVAFNAWGEVSQPVTRVVTRDLSGPPMTLSAPFVSAPWPFTARIAGVAEPGATVQVNDGKILTTTSRGFFETRVTLAPWPQDVRFRAVDETGNETVRVLSMMGGLDVRQLPWQIIVAILVLVAVLSGTIREGRRVQARLVADHGSVGPGAPRPGRPGWPRRRERAWLADERDDLPLPEIEEIPPTGR